MYSIQKYFGVFKILSYKLISSAGQTAHNISNMDDYGESHATIVMPTLKHD